MPTFLLASTAGSLDGLIRSQLWIAAVENGTYIHPRSGEVRPRYDMTGYTVRHLAGRQMTRKENGIHRVIWPDVMSVSGRTPEMLDKSQAILTYTLTRKEQLDIRSVYPSGIPGTFQLGWEREIHGPMSPTVEQSVMYAKHDTGADGTTFTIVNPTSGNLLVVSHGYYWRGTTLGDATATGAGGTTFTNRGQAGSANFENYQCIMDRISNGAEGTTITVTNGGVSQENSGGFFEVSGMTASPFVAISAGADGGSGTVTTVGTGNVDTTGTDNTWLLAAFGTEDVISSRTYDPTSFAEAGTIQGTGDSDHGTSIALRTVASASTYSCAMSWPTACTASGIVAAYAITVASPPVNTTPAAGFYLPTTSSGATTLSDYSTLSVAEGTGTVTSITLSVPSGKGTWTLTASGSVSLTGNGTNSVVLTLGASISEYNTVLATAAFQGAEGIREVVTATLLSSDGTLSDSDNFSLFNDPTNLTIVGDTYADLIAAIQTVYMRLPANTVSDTITIVATDQDTLSDTQVITLFVPPVSGDGDLPLLASTRGITDVIM